MEVSVWDVGAADVCVRLSPCFSFVAPLVRDPIICGVFWESEFFAWTFVVGDPGFPAAGGWVARLPTWLLVRTLGAVDRERVGSFIFALTPLAGAVAWLGAGGEVGASDGTIAVAISHVRWRSVVPAMVRRGRGSCGMLSSVAGTLGQDGLVLRFSCLG